MNPFAAYIELLTKPKTFYKKYKDQPKKVLLLNYAIMSVLFLIALLGVLFAERLSAIELTFTIIILLIMFAIGVPLLVGISGLIYHIGVLIFGGRGISKSITIFGASLLIGLPYGLINLFFEIAFGELIGLLLSIPVSVIALIHVIYAEVQGIQVHYKFPTGKAILISLFPLIIGAILGIILFILIIIALIGVGVAGGL